MNYKFFTSALISVACIGSSFADDEIRQYDRHTGSSSIVAATPCEQKIIEKIGGLIQVDQENGWELIISSTNDTCNSVYRDLLRFQGGCDGRKILEFGLYISSPEGVRIGGYNAAEVLLTDGIAQDGSPICMIQNANIQELKVDLSNNLAGNEDGKERLPASSEEQSCGDFSGVENSPRGSNTHLDFMSNTNRINGSLGSRFSSGAMGI
jgi:hypothetical protein